MGSTITLQGAGTDTEGAIASHAWTQSAPTSAAGLNIGLSATDVAMPACTVPEGLTVGDQLLFSLIVTDSGALPSTADTVTITVIATNTAPVANAGR